MEEVLNHSFFLVLPAAMKSLANPPSLRRGVLNYALAQMEKHLAVVAEQLANRCLASCEHAVLNGATWRAAVENETYRNNPKWSLINGNKSKTVPTVCSVCGKSSEAIFQEALPVVDEVVDLFIGKRPARWSDDKKIQDAIVVAIDSEGDMLTVSTVLGGQARMVQKHVSLVQRKFVGGCPGEGLSGCVHDGTSGVTTMHPCGDASSIDHYDFHVKDEWALLSLFLPRGFG